MIIQKFSITGQHIERTNRLSLVADSHNFIQFQFEFPAEWAGVGKTAVITTGGTLYNCVIDADGGIALKNMPTLAPGLCSVSVFGGDLFTTDSCTMTIYESGMKNGTTPPAPPVDIYNQILTRATNAETHAISAENLANDSQNKAASEAKTAGDSAVAAAAAAGAARLSQTAAESSSAAAKASETAADTSEAEALLSRQKAQQALADLLKIIGTDIATLVGGKIPMSQIPATATQEIYTVKDESELVGLTAQRGDLAELITVVGGIQTITKTWQLLGTSTVAADWVPWGTAYAVSAGNASTATNADNAAMINNHRMVEMQQAAFDTAVKDPATYYLVTA